jgi:hypothetical protein
MAWCHGITLAALRDRATLESSMQRHFLIAAAVLFVSWPAGVVLAQTTPSTGTGATTTAPAATPPAATTAAPAATTTAPAATTETKPAEPAKPGDKKKTAKKMTRQQEIDKSVDGGTVPSRYRSSIPKQYHQYIPFDR